MRIFSSIVLLAFLLSSCGTPVNNDGKTNADPAAKRDSMLKLIKGDEDRIAASAKNAMLSPELASQAVNHYTLFAREFPKDSNAAMYMFKAADIYASAMHKYDQAIELLQKIISDHPGFRKMPVCYFELGVIYDDYLNDDAKAKEYYEDFLKKYPDHPLAPQVKSLISYLGKSNEELMKEFEKKNEGK
jgi:TolA-binding protein